MAMSTDTVHKARQLIIPKHALRAMPATFSCQSNGICG